MIETLVLFLKLLISHALCDFSLQSSAMAAGKNRNIRPIDDALPPGQKLSTIWPYWLTSHALIHAGGVLVVTGNVPSALFQFFSHWFIDFMKCEGFTNPHIDQALHMLVLGMIALAPVAF